MKVAENCHLWQGMDTAGKIIGDPKTGKKVYNGSNTKTELESLVKCIARYKYYTSEHRR